MLQILPILLIILILLTPPILPILPILDNPVNLLLPILLILDNPSILPILDNPPNPASCVYPAIPNSPSILAVVAVYVLAVLRETNYTASSPVEPFYCVAMHLVSFVSLL